MDTGTGRGEDETTLTAADDVAVLLRRPDSLRSVFQPVVDLRSGDVVGYEALTRVASRPARSPEPWFSAADRAGLAPQLEAATLAGSLRVRQDLRPGQFLSVNLSCAVLAHPAVTEVLTAQGSLEGLVVDLAELGRLADAESVALENLRTHGLMVATTVREAGRSELTGMRALRPDLVKLGGELVAGAHADPLRGRLIRMAVELGASDGAGILGQGLESLDDVRFLQSAGVRLGEGWLLGRARPMLLPTPEETVAWIRASWEECVTLTRVGSLALPIPRIGEAENPDWAADLDADGRLRALVGRDGTTLAAMGMVQLRASTHLRAAATRMVSADPRRRPHGLVAVVDDGGRFIGLADGQALIREALAVAPG